MGSCSRCGKPATGLFHDTWHITPILLCDVHRAVHHAAVKGMRSVVFDDQINEVEEAETAS